MYTQREPRDWMRLGEMVFGVPAHEQNVHWLPATTDEERVYLAAAQRQQRQSLEFQALGAEAAQALGARFSLRWIAARLHTLDYHGAYAVLRGRTRMNLEHIVDFTQAVSPPPGTVEAVVRNDSK